MTKYLPKAMMSLEAAREHATRVREHLPSSHAEHALVALDDELRAARPLSVTAGHRKYAELRASVTEFLAALERGEHVLTAIELSDLRKHGAR